MYDHFYFTVNQRANIWTLMIESNMTTLKTPCLMLDIARVRHNAERVSQIAANNGVRLRPHIKTHKCAEVARIQTAGHSGAVTASTLAEIRALSDEGFTDFTYAVPIEPGKFDEAIEIVRSGVRLYMLTDSTDIPPALNKASAGAGVSLDVFMKVDCGYHRCGVDPTSKKAMAIPRLISGADHLNFAGILTHAGHSYHASSKEEIARIAANERDIMVKCADKIREGGVEVPTVSIGSTPSITHVDHLRGIDEIRPGNYIFYDAFQATLGSCSFDDCALTVLTAVVHVSRENKKIVVDAGAIALSKDRGAVELDTGCGYGRVLDLFGRDLNLRVTSLSQEHGEILVEDDSLFDKFRVGTRVRILPNHSCLSAAQHRHYHVLENNAVVDKWKIARGW